MIEGKIIVGLGYKAGSGKDTVGKYLCDKQAFRKLSFADPLKKGLIEQFGFNHNQVFGTQEQKEAPDEFWSEKFSKPISARWAMQYIGTDCFRDKVHRDFWIWRAEKLMRDTAIVRWVVTDLRFKNECEYVKKWGGIIIRLDRDSNSSDTAIEAYQKVNNTDKAPESEVDLLDYDGWDYVIDNNGDLETTFKAVQAAIKDRFPDIVYRNW